MHVNVGDGVCACAVSRVAVQYTNRFQRASKHAKRGNRLINPIAINHHVSLVVLLAGRSVGED